MGERAIENKLGAGRMLQRQGPRKIHSEEERKFGCETGIDK